MVELPTLGGAQLWADRRYRDGWRVQEHVLTGACRLLDARDWRRAAGPLAHCVEALEARSPPPCPPHVVVVLHGLGRSRRSMRSMAAALRGAGLAPMCLDYPSTRRPIAAHVEQVAEVLEHLPGATDVSFVTHSLGGIVARGVLARGSLPLSPRRLVMLAPPNQGASFARQLRARAPRTLSGLAGPAALELADGVEYPAPAIPFLVVAARRPGGLNPWIEGEDDGVVGVEETRLPGAHEHLVVDAVHTLLMNHPEAQRAAARFLAAP